MEHTMTNEQALRYALEYIADCLEKDEVYLVSTDEFARGAAMNPHLVAFARRVSKDCSNWTKWCDLREQMRGQAQS